MLGGRILRALGTYDEGRLNKTNKRELAVHLAVNVVLPYTGRQGRVRGESVPPKEMTLDNAKGRNAESSMPQAKTASGWALEGFT
jgi:hypothetical protein